MASHPFSSSDQEGVEDNGKSASRPAYMTVGSGSTSESASRLTAMLDDDSGYGGSTAQHESFGVGWHSEHAVDYPASTGTGKASETERRSLAGHIHQLHYNQNRSSLGRSIHQTVDLLGKLRDMNSKWPIHYPSVSGQADAPQFPPVADTRPEFQNTHSALDLHHPTEIRPIPGSDRMGLPRRAATSLGDNICQPESSARASQGQQPEPRLVLPQLAQDFSILKIDLKMGGHSQTDLVHKLEKGSIASLLDEQISKSIRHLYSMRERIDDTSSKVLVTGDLNAGKSTFCNALLRKKVLPEDEQPCTSIFCEVLDVRENGGVEEVHAVPLGSEYKRDDESTYKVFALRQLEWLVSDNEHFSQCKIYVKDIRTVDESLLNNGVVDIALIDAPGLNNDSLKTTAVFARQEEIDVVVFVVSANNQITESSANFISSAAREKDWIFMVVNGYDKIRDKSKCQRRVLGQVCHLSPKTFKDSSELVHFVSSIAVPVTAVDYHSTGVPPKRFSGGSDDEGDDDGPSDEPHGKRNGRGSPAGKQKGKELEKIRDFEELEASLRRFVLDRRARSKLAPAKTYLMNLLGDLSSLATVNCDLARSELDRVSKMLAVLQPECEQSKRDCFSASEEADRIIDGSASEVYSYARDTLNSKLSHVGELELGVPYPGLLRAYQYAEDVKLVMLQDISETVEVCEEYARKQTTVGFNGITQLGSFHLGQGQMDHVFNSGPMFRSKKHSRMRQVDVSIDLLDFFDAAGLWERQEKVASTSMAVTVAGVLGSRMIGGVSLVDSALGAAKVIGSTNIKKMAIPGLVAIAVLGVSYVISSISRSLPRRLSNKLSTQLTSVDYIHDNAMRISAEVRRALRIPSEDLRVGFQRRVEKLQGEKVKTTKLKEENEVARKYFANLIRGSNMIRQTVEHVDLENPSPEVGSSYKQ